MTFYSLIFAVLFLAAGQELLRAVFKPSTGCFLCDPTFWMASAIALLVFNDTVCTAHIFEDPSATTKRRYTFTMKMLDLLNFFVLGSAIIVLNPQSNLFSIDASSNTIINGTAREPLFWLVLSVYWVVAIAWDVVGGVYARSLSHRMRVVSYALGVPFVVLCVVTYFSASPLVIWPLRIVVVGLVAVYFIVYKRLVVSIITD